MDTFDNTTSNNRISPAEDGVLSGLRVLDLTRVLAGPYSGMILADMGAEVIKLEVPGRGDDSRYFPPFVKGESLYYRQVNRNKKSIALNLKTPAGKEIFKRLIPKVDVLLENFRPGVMDELGLGYAVLKELNPRLIYGALSGFGQTGPYAKRAGYDIIAQAMGGMMSVTGWPDGVPTRSGPAIGDVLGGLNLVIGVLSAYIRSCKTGMGDMVDIALTDSVVSALDILPENYFATGKSPGRLGNLYPSCYPYDSFQAADGMYVIGVGNDKLFSIVVNIIGRPELAEDERFLTNDLRLQNRDSLKAMIEEWSASLTAAQAAKLLNDAGCPAAEVYDVEKITKDPHIAGARQMFADVDDPVIGPTHVTGSVFKFARGKAQVRHAAPLLGADTEQVLKDYIDCDEEELKQWKRDGIIG